MKRLIIAFVVIAALGPIASANGFLSSVSVAADRIVVRVPVDIVHASPRLIARWQQAIDARWNRGNDGRPFTVCGRPVYFDAQFTPRPARQALAHVVFVEAVAPGQRYVSSVWHALGTSPAASPRTGFWSDALADGTVAHEFGHLLGLDDEYTEEDANGNGMRDPGEGSLPDVREFPTDAWLSLMANEHGTVLERHIHGVLRAHGAADVLDCSR